MKYLLLTALLSFSAFAKELNFSCEFTNSSHVHQFSIAAKSIDSKDGEFSNVEFDFLVRKAGRDQQPERLVVTRNGEVHFFPAGTLYPHPTVRLVSISKGSEVEYINLLIDMTPLHISQIRLLSGMTYFGTCKSH